MAAAGIARTQPVGTAQPASSGKGGAAAPTSKPALPDASYKSRTTAGGRPVSPAQGGKARNTGSAAPKPATPAPGTPPTAAAQPKPDPLTAITGQAKVAQPGAPAPAPAGAGQPTAAPTAAPQPTVLKGDADSITIADPNFGSMQKYQDQAYNHAMRSLQPQMDADRKRFEQQLVNKGIDPNSEAGIQALKRMQMGHNDMTQSAMFNAMQFGQQAQNQAYNQGLGASQLAANMAQARMSDATQRYGINTNADVQRHGIDTRADTQRYGIDVGADTQRYGIDTNAATSRYGMDLNDKQYYAGLGEQQRQFDSNDQFRYTGMLGNLLGQAYGADQGAWGANQQRDLQQFNARQGVMGAIPGWNPAMVDVNGSANAATNSQQAAFSAGMEKAAAPWQTAGSVAGAAMGAFMSDERLKDNLEPIGTTAKGLTWYRWTWNDVAKDKFGLEGEAEGMVAQEVPEEYTFEREGYLGIDYDRLIREAA